MQDKLKTDQFVRSFFIIIHGDLETNMFLPSLWAFVMGVSAIWFYKNLEDGGLNKWAGLIVFPIASLLDFVLGLNEIILIQPKLIVDTRLIVLPTVSALIFSLLHFWTLKILLRQEVKLHYIGQDLSLNEG